MMFDELQQIARTWTPGTIILRIGLLSLLWFVLAEGEFRYWGLVLLAVLGGAGASLVLIPSSNLGFSVSGWARFIPYFLWQSVLGGIDVALRSIAIPVRLDPGYVEVEFRLADEPARVFVANTMSLMPGTLSVSLDGDRLRMHVLDRSMPNQDRAREVEAHVSRMFRLELAD
jgi:multicomponent Na+:H+ antiporter subunit E